MIEMKSVKKLIKDLSPIGLGSALVIFGMSLSFAQGESRNRRVSKQPTIQQFEAALSASKRKHIKSNDKYFAPARLGEGTNPKMASASTFSQMQTMSFKTKANEESFFSGMVNLSYSQSMIDLVDGSKQASRSIVNVLSFKVSENYSLNSKFSIDQNLRNSEIKEGNGVSDIRLSLDEKPSGLFKWLDGSYGVIGMIPTSEQSSRVVGLQAVLGMSYSFALTPAVLAKGFATSFTLTAVRSFHEYETSLGGTVLNPYTLREAFSASYTYAETLSLSFDFLHRHAWSYGGNVSESFEHSQELGYKVNPQWRLAIGHTNSGSWLKENGQDSNLKLINEKDSIVYLSTSVMF